MTPNAHLTKITLMIKRVNIGRQVNILILNESLLSKSDSVKIY